MRLRTIVAFGVGATVAFLLDPVSGRGRRQVLGDRIEHLSTRLRARSRGWPGEGDGRGTEPGVSTAGGSMAGSFTAGISPAGASGRSSRIRSGFGSRPRYGDVGPTSEFDDPAAGSSRVDDAGSDDAGRSDVGFDDAASGPSPSGAPGRRGTPTDPLLEPVTPAIR